MNRIFTPVLLFFSFYVNAQWTQTKGPYAARTTAMITVGNNIYAANRDHGGTDGRVYRSSNLGLEWVPADNGIGAAYVQQFANIGETIVAASANFFGIYRTTDQGTNWAAITSGIFAPALSIEAVGDTFWLGTDGGGVFRSVDLGLTWQPMNNPVLDGRPVIVYDIQYHNNILFLATEGGGGPANLYRSFNNGASWEYANTGLPPGTNPHQFTTNGNTIFVSCEGDFAQYDYGLYRSDDNGNTWTECNNGIPEILNGNTGEIWAHNGVVYASVTYPDANPKVYKSIDNGNSFLPASSGLHLENQVVEAYTAAGGYIFAGAGWYASVYRSANEGASWEEARRGLNNARVFSLMEQNGRVYAGTQEGLFYSIDGGDKWIEIAGGLPYGTPVTTMEKNGSTIMLGTDQYGIYRSVDNGASYTLVNTGLNSTFASYINDLLFFNNTYYVATWDGIYRSTNGDVWTLSSNGLPTDFGGSLVTVNTLSVSNGVLFAGTVLEGIYRSTDGGLNWVSSSSGLPFPARTVQDIIPVGTDLLTATDDGVYRSTNGGLNWTITTLNGGSMKRLYLGNGIVYASQFGPTVLTGYGVYRSLNNGVSWEPFDDGMFPTARVMAFLFSGGNIYGGTDTRSVWRRPGGAVPVTLSGFSGQRIAGGNLLSWSTSMEVDNAGFDLQRSRDGRSFSNIAFIGSLAAGGNSQLPIRYQFTDPAPTGDLWYRLVQTDRNGRSSLSHTVFLRSGHNERLRMHCYPSPVVHTLYIRFNKAVDDKILISVFDMNGRKVSLEQVTAGSGQHLEVDVSKLPAGEYIVYANDGSGNEVSGKFTRQ